jgi:hypothetical protein
MSAKLVVETNLKLIYKTLMAGSGAVEVEQRTSRREMAIPGRYASTRSQLHWTSRTFYFPDSRDHLEVLGASTSQILGTFSRFSGDFLGRERGGVPRGSSRTLGDPPWGLSLSLPRKSSENLEKVPRIWEVEGTGGPR